MIKFERIVEIHLAGFVDKGNYCLDSHNRRVHQNVWELYKRFTKNFGKVPTLIEWDHEIPEFSVLFGEGKKAEKIYYSGDNGRSGYEHAIAS